MEEEDECKRTRIKEEVMEEGQNNGEGGGGRGDKNETFCTKFRCVHVRACMYACVSVAKWQHLPGQDRGREGIGGRHEEEEDTREEVMEE